MTYQAQYDKQARGWNVIEIASGRIVGMFRSRKQAERSAELSSRLEAAWGTGPASPPPASRPTDLPLLWSALTSGNVTLAQAVLLGNRR